MNALISSLPPPFHPIDAGIKGIAQTSFNLTRKVITLSLKYFGIIQSAYFYSYGAMEIIEDRISHYHAEAKKTYVGSQMSQTCQRIASFVKSLFSYRTVHGSLFMTVGTCEVARNCHQLDYINLGAALTPVSMLSQACFISANILMLAHYVRILRDISKLPVTIPDEAKKEARRLQLLAIISIFSTLNYIAATAAFMADGPVALVVVLLTLGLCAGGAKNVLELLLRIKEERVLSFCNAS